ncbi:RagB/SusD family nutrient uptake outer membrane protein [Maribacter sp. MMG018]|uniref:RagB/SusD family nutrient uptake outer membrane protein n=1 Tax=Maribacter sp. MMG018 TaxID=2822688 RepID=UPI001B375454|nr:RagB/SusD family nutrient uptake outer membrane protein [Maribacter sp. MMG018]MBQ4913933.1 RagB/SusD family nutrient uptake outer membrane protein [Maribacter sp. MMG018]
MKKIRIIFAALTGLLVLVTGCSDEFLTREPEGQFGQPSLQTADGVEGILLGAYAMIDGAGLDGTADWNVTVENWAFNIASDDALKGTDAGDQPEQSFIEAYDFQAFNGHITNRWRSLYKGIARTNDAIVSARAVEEIDDARREQIIAEARFLRGIFHMEARKMWKRPPYISDEVYDINDVNSTLVPNDREIWPDIEEDFKAAAAVLPETQSQVGRPTSWAAKAFLAKSLVYQGWNEDGSANIAKLEEAKPILENILNDGPFSLAEKFQDNFLVATRNNSESIFEIQYAVSSAADQASSRGMGLAHPYIDPWGCCGFYQVSQNLVNAYQTEDGLPLLDNFDDTDVPADINEEDYTSPVTTPLDPRIDHTVGRPGILYKGFKIYDTDFVRDLSYAGPFFSKKHVAEPEGFGIGGWGNLTANNYRYMRLDMIILWLAEVEVELGNLEPARLLVNRIRERAANPADFVPKATKPEDGGRNDFVIEEGVPAANYQISTYEDAWTDQDFARKAVRFETRLEFAMEGHRFWDLVRWGIAAETLNAYIASESEHRSYLSGRSFVEGKNEYFPIPSQAIDRSFKEGTATLTQDPAY